MNDEINHETIKATFKEMIDNNEGCRSVVKITSILAYSHNLVSLEAKLR